jgi:hypothetical protein
MRVYDGAAWQAAYLPSTGYVQKTGDTMTGTLTLPSEILTGNLGLGATPDYGTAGQVMKSAGAGAAPTWNNLFSYLPVYLNAGTITQISVANGYVPVLTFGGSTINVSVT